MSRVLSHKDKASNLVYGCKYDKLTPTQQREIDLFLINYWL